jgi:hypothetical protein
VRNTFRRFLRRLVAAAVLLLLLLGGGAWWSGRLLVERLAETLGLEQGAGIRAGLVLALPVVNLAYGRDLVIQLRDQETPVTLSFNDFHCFLGEGGSGKRSWRVGFSGLKFEHGADALAAARMSAEGRYDREAGRVELRGGELDYLVLSAGGAAMTSFTRLAFQRLDFDVRAARAALGRPDDGFTPLDLFWQLEEARLENFKIGLAFLDGYETAPLNVGLSGHNSAAGWALDVKMTAAQADDSGLGPRQSLSGFLQPLSALDLDFPKLLRFDRLNFHGSGDWADGGHIRTESLLLFPRLFGLTITGVKPSVSRVRADEWLGGCFQGRAENNEGPRCLSALGFNTFSVDYSDRGMSALAKTIAPFQKRIFDENDPSGPLGLPALGLALGLWLNQNRPDTPAGVFDFSPKEGVLFPFRREFLQNILGGGEAPFTAPQ